MSTVAAEPFRAFLAGLRRGGSSPMGASVATSAIILGLNALTGILIARTLGPQGRGELTAILLWPTLLASMGFLGLAEATTFHVSRATATLGRLAGTSLAISVVQSVVLAGIGAVVIPHALSRYDGDVVQTAYLFLLYIPLFFLMNYPLSLLQGLQRFGSVNVVRLLAFAPAAGGLLVLAFADRLTVETAALTYLGTYLVTGVAAVGLLFRAGAIQLSFDFRLTRQLLGFGVRSHTASASSNLNEWLDQVVISVFLAPVKLGLYVIAVTLSSLTALVGLSVSLIALPVLARLEPGPERSARAARYARLTLVGAAVVTLPMVVLAPAVIRLLFGESFEGAANVSRVLLVAAVVLTTNRTLGAILNAVGRPLDAGVAELVALAVTVAGLAALLPTLGLMGAAIASLLAYVVSMAWLTVKASRALDLAVRDLFRLRPLAAQS